MIETRVLVAYDDEYRAYREVIAAGIYLLRPQVEVATCTPDELPGGGPELFDPQVVICGRPSTAHPGDVPAWVDLPMEPELPAKIRVGGRRRSPADVRRPRARRAAGGHRRGRETSPGKSGPRGLPRPIWSGKERPSIVVATRAISKTGRPAS